MSTELTIENNNSKESIENNTEKFVTIKICNQLFCLSAMTVKDVLLAQSITYVPLVSKEVMGLLNLRGRIVTVIDLRVKMGMEPSENRLNHKSLVVEHDDNLYSFVVDEVTGVHDISLNEIEHNPENLSEGWKKYCSGIYKLEKELMVILNVDGLLGDTA